MHRRGHLQEEGEWTACDRELGEWVWRRSASDPRLAIHRWEGRWIKTRTRDAERGRGPSQANLEPPEEGEAGSTPRGSGKPPGLTPELERVAATWPRDRQPNGDSGR